MNNDSAAQPPTNPNYSAPSDFGLGTPYPTNNLDSTPYSASGPVPYVAGSTVPYPTDNVGEFAPPSYQDAVKDGQKNTAPPPMYTQPMYPNPPPNPYGPMNSAPIYPNPPINRTGGPTIIVNQPVAIRFGQSRVSTVCPYCAQSIVTSTTNTAGTYAVFVAAILCVCGLGLCAFLPFVMPDCQDVSHSCPNCKRHISTFRRM